MLSAKDAKSSTNGHDGAADARERRRQDGRECLAAAFDYLALGWSVLAVCPPDHVGVGSTHAKKCKNPGKAPWGEWKTYQSRLPTEEEVRRKWRDNETLNVGMALGPVSGLIGIDIDGAQGELRLQELSGGDLPWTLEFSTPGGGRRLLYRIPKDAKLRPTFQAVGVKEEVRFLAYGSQTVLPPSRHRDSGGRYQWKSGQAPEDKDPADAPSWLMRELARPRHENNGDSRTDGGGRITEGSRNSTLCSLAGSMRQRGFCQSALEAALIAENQERCDPPLEEEEVCAIARSVGRYEPGPLPSQTGVEVILGYFREIYHPVFRRGPILFSAKLGREVKASEACQGASSELIEKLAGSQDAPKQSDMTADRSKLPSFFKKWVPVAWADLMRELPEEEKTAEICDSAKDEFKSRLAEVLNSMMSFGEFDRDAQQTKIERRSLLDWCSRWTKPGAWKSIRSLKLWTKRNEAGVIQIALRAELFGQVSRGKIAQGQIGTLAELYDLGYRTKVAGQRAIELSSEFLAEQMGDEFGRCSRENGSPASSAQKKNEGNACEH